MQLHACVCVCLWRIIVIRALMSVRNQAGKRKAWSERRGALLLRRLSGQQLEGDLSQSISIYNENQVPKGWEWVNSPEAECQLDLLGHFRVRLEMVILESDWKSGKNMFFSKRWLELLRDQMLLQCLHALVWSFHMGMDNSWARLSGEGKLITWIEAMQPTVFLSLGTPHRWHIKYI